MISHLNKRFVYLIFLAGLFILLGTSFLAYQKIQALLDANALVIHTHEVIEKTNEVLISMIDAERLEQSYLNSNNESYLRGYEQSLQKAKESVAALKHIIKDNPTQQLELEKLNPLLDSHIVFFQNIIKVYKASGKQAAMQIMLSSKHQDLINQIKQTVSDMANTEFSLLQMRNASVISDSHQTNLMMIVVGTLTCFLLLQSLLLLTLQEKKHFEDQLKINRELDEKNKKIEEASRLKSEFLANMSHELRTPLNAIIGFSELMQTKDVGPITPEQEDFLVDILGSAKHLLQLITDVLDLSKVEAGKMDFYPEKVDLTKLVKEVTDVLMPLINKKSIYLTTTIDKELNTVYIDPSRFKQVLYNYLSNAVKFTPELGSVKIFIKPETPTSFRLEVEDNGIGIKPEDMKRLFLAFEQLDASTVKKYAGTGLGLALTKNIVEAQGGQVDVRSSLGVGSVFSAIIPNHIELKGLAKESKKRLQTVLVVESNKSDIEWVVNILLTKDFAVDTAQTGKMAIHFCETRKFDLIILDVILSDMDGMTLIEKIHKTSNANTPVILTIGAKAHSVVMKGMSNHNQQLLHEINKLIEQA